MVKFFKSGAHLIELTIIFRMVSRIGLDNLGNFYPQHQFSGFQECLKQSFIFLTKLYDLLRLKAWAVIQSGIRGSHVPCSTNFGALILPLITQQLFFAFQ
ncbi:hypothetical protein FGO68_gene15888 [Halteria grandinella]|uniref:Uncharacterized protein n=1 Tax=Halteria grandinella TaxID=5974 RepID=A0A8J8T1Y3_HALGN|nr:hypothetical protein FGO68_gene15888 [Halteria grandinella]